MNNLYRINEESKDNVYVNVKFGNDTFPGDHSVQAEYKVTKTIPIIDKCDDYYCSVIRFDLPLDEVPLFIFPVNPGSGTAQTSPLQIGIGTLVGSGPTYTNYMQSIIYGFDNTNGPINGFPPVNQTDRVNQIITQYYYVYEYSHMLTFINNALGAAFIASGIGGNCPYFYLGANGIIHLVADISTFSVTQRASNLNPPAPIYQQNIIIINDPLATYLGAFPLRSYTISGNPRYYFFDLTSFSSSYLIPPFSTSSPTQKDFPQEYSVLELWSSLRKIVFVSSSIPIDKEFLSTNSSGSSALLPVITDFTPEITNPQDARSIAYYNPSAQYRLINLTSTEALYTIDIKVYWQDKLQNLYPLFISRFQQGNLKIGFFKKQLYKNKANHGK